MHEALLDSYPNLKLGDHIFIPNSLHVYERHFDKIRHVVENNRQYES
jgi:thymidylate synthase